jgi:thiol:disulfide interchange protein
MSAGLRLFIALLVTFAVWSGAAQAQSRGVEPDLVFETLSPRPGSLVRVALVMEAKPGWHAYWRNPGEVGAPPRIRWRAPGDFMFSELRHPVPKVMDVQGIVSFVHEGSFALLTTMRVPNGITPGEPIPLTAEVSWLACSTTQCVPESRTLEKVLVAGAGDTDYPGLSRIRQAEARLPTKTTKGTFSYVDGRFVLSLPGGSPSAVLIPYGQGWIDASASAKTTAFDDGIRIVYPADTARKKGVFEGLVKDGRDAVIVSAEWMEPPVQVDTVAMLPGEVSQDGTVMASDDDGVVIEAEDLPSRSSPSPVSAQAGLVALPSLVDMDAGGASFIGILIAAVMGGLLLNLMPCVFPILSLKALSLAHSASDEVLARREGLGYTLGTVLSVLILGTVILALRETGVSAGWSFQLQSPLFVLAMIGLVSVIALNLSGAFEFAQLGRSAGLSSPGFRGAAGTGAMAALIASPCAGPFMAGALGAALVLPVPAALAVFAGLGLGMAVPFLMVAYVPWIRTRLPRPGRWMGSLRRILAIPMALTAVWLAWVLWRQTGTIGLVVSVVVVVIISAGLAHMGARQRKGRPARMSGILTACISFVVIAAFSSVNIETVRAGTRMPQDGLVFSEALLEETVSSGTPVLLDFTADWCLTCKVNEKVALDDEAVIGALDRAGVVVMTGDWTNGDPAITAFLEKNGRNSIPFYVLYDGKGGARVLPQVLTPSLLVSEIESAGRGISPR